MSSGDRGRNRGYRGRGGRAGGRSGSGNNYRGGRPGAGFSTGGDRPGSGFSTGGDRFGSGFSNGGGRPGSNNRGGLGNLPNSRDGSNENRNRDDRMRDVQNNDRRENNQNRMQRRQRNNDNQILEETNQMISGRNQPNSGRRPAAPSNNSLTIEQTRNLLEKLNDDNYRGSITMELTEPNNRLKNFLNYINNRVYSISGHDTAKLILKVIIKAKNEPAYSATYGSLLTEILNTQFCEKYLDKLINIDIFEAISIDWDLIELLMNYFIINLTIIQSHSYEHIGPRISNLIHRLDSTSLQLPNNNNNIKLLLDELKILYNKSKPIDTNDKIINNKHKRLREEINEELNPPDNFRNISIFPDTKDLIEIQTNNVFIRRNKSRGIYKSVDDYLDIQFRLMREDFIQPLREGLLMYKTNSNKKQNDIRIYNNVQLINTLPFERQGIIHTLSFDLTKFKRIRWEQTKRFIYGSLLCLSDDNFNTTLLFATIADRNIKDLSKGEIKVKFLHNLKPKKDVDYILIESTNMFESYRHVLKRLQNMNELNLCMKDYLVYAKSDINKPQYLRVYAGRKYTFNSFDLYPGSETFKWPRPIDLSMDDSQFNAFKNALTNEITIIQGPPGTGKTFIGLKICQCLLDNIVNITPNFGPILIVCYTNHALDQFLEGISEFTNKIVRVGSRCKSEKLEQYSLIKLKVKNRNDAVSKRRWKIIKELNEYKDDILQYQLLLNTSHSRLVQLNRLAPFIPEYQMNYIRNINLKNWLYGSDYVSTFNEYYLDELDDIIEWLMYEEYNTLLKSIAEEAYNELNYNNEDDYEYDDDLEGNFINNLRRLDEDDINIDTLTNDLERVLNRLNIESHFENVLNDDIIDDDGFKMVRTKTTENLFKSRLKSTKFMNKDDVELIDDLASLDINKRWDLYRYWRHLFIEQISKQSEKIEEDYERKSAELQEMSFEEDRLIMMQQNIIGMTTTGAARYGDILETIQCKVIIVEEAAEVLESHIIGSLNHACQHLILIGDHKQLKPNPSVYELSIRYNLDLSLFERLINNDLNYVTLQIQHRMRPEIAQLMTHIYDNIKNHESVFKYPSVPSIGHNLYFLTHTNEEKHVNDIMSYSNPYEAEFVVKLCRHLMKNGIKNENITILTLYTGQMFEIRKLMKDRKLYDKLRICVVDNYQGEENDIIILSLVRSNSNCNIGFLKIENRICVSLSRAKHGLYIFGNSNMFNNEKDAPLWKKVCLDLRDRNLLGKTLKLNCQIHPTKQLKEIGKPSDFDLYPEGGCDIICNERLNCGHSCKKMCHFLDRTHKEYCCTEQCMKPCQNCGFKCIKKCYQACGDCNRMVMKKIPDCEHEQLIPCSKKPTSTKCINKCNRILTNCGHECTKLCKDKCEPCKKKIMKTCIDCFKSDLYECSMDINEISCKTKCNVKLNCNHLCNGTCGSCFNSRLHRLCDKKCQRIQVCGHLCQEKCNIECPPCQEKCENACVHNSCSNKCGETCIDCHEKCKWRCIHRKCTNLCYEICNRDVCNELCPRTKLICIKCDKKFRCYGICGEECRKICQECDESGMMDIFFGTEDKENAQFITLWSCGHSFEVSGMDEYMKVKMNDIEISLINCPKCKTIISPRSCYRYSNIIKRKFGDVKKIQMKINNDFNLPTTNIFMDNYERYQYIIKDLFKYYKYNDYLTQYYNDFKNEKISNLFIKKLQISLDFIILINDKIYEKHKSMDPHTDSYTYINRCVVKLLIWLNPTKRQFNKMDYDQFYNEIERIKLMLYFIKELTLNEFKVIEDLYEELRNKKPEYNEDLKAYMNTMKDKIRNRLNLPNMDITENERRQILNAIGLGKGRWFKCSNGHYYVIGECGGASQVSRCPECNDDIGGHNHQLLRHNRFAPEMDDAHEPAWPNMDNLAPLDLD